MIDEQKRLKAEADEAFKAKEAALSERERQLNEQSQLSQQELEAERKRIAEERERALADAKALGSKAASNKVKEAPTDWTVPSKAEVVPTPTPVAATSALSAAAS